MLTIITRSKVGHHHSSRTFHCNINQTSLSLSTTTTTTTTITRKKKHHHNDMNNNNKIRYDCFNHTNNDSGTTLPLLLQLLNHNNNINKNNHHHHDIQFENSVRKWNHHHHHHHPIDVMNQNSLYMTSFFTKRNPLPSIIKNSHRRNFTTTSTTPPQTTPTPTTMYVADDTSWIKELENKLQRIRTKIPHSTIETTTTTTTTTIQPSDQVQQTVVAVVDNNNDPLQEAQEWYDQHYHSYIRQLNHRFRSSNNQNHNQNHPNNLLLTNQLSNKNDELKKVQITLFDEWMIRHDELVQSFPHCYNNNNNSHTNNNILPKRKKGLVPYPIQQHYKQICIAATTSHNLLEQMELQFSQRFAFLIDQEKQQQQQQIRKQQQQIHKNNNNNNNNKNNNNNNNNNKSGRSNNSSSSHLTDPIQRIKKATMDGSISSSSLRSMMKINDDVTQRCTDVLKLYETTMYLPWFYGSKNDYYQEGTETDVEVGGTTTTTLLPPSHFLSSYENVQSTLVKLPECRDIPDRATFLFERMEKTYLDALEEQQETNYEIQKGVVPVAPQNTENDDNDNDNDDNDNDDNDNEKLQRQQMLDPNNVIVEPTFQCYLHMIHIITYCVAPHSSERAERIYEKLHALHLHGRSKNNSNKKDAEDHLERMIESYRSMVYAWQNINGVNKAKSYLVSMLLQLEKNQEATMYKPNNNNNNYSYNNNNDNDDTNDIYGYTDTGNNNNNKVNEWDKNNNIHTNHNNPREKILGPAMNEFKSILWTTVRVNTSGPRAWGILKLMQEMYTKGFTPSPPDLQCYQLVIQACSNDKKLPHVAAIACDEAFETMKRNYVIPNDITYTFAIQSWKNVATHPLVVQKVKEFAVQRCLNLMNEKEEATQRNNMFDIRVNTMDMKNILAAIGSLSYVKPTLVEIAENLLNRLEERIVKKRKIISGDSMVDSSSFNETENEYASTEDDEVDEEEEDEEEEEEEDEEFEVKRKKNFFEYTPQVIPTLHIGPPDSFSYSSMLDILKGSNLPDKLTRAKSVLDRFRYIYVPYRNNKSSVQLMTRRSSNHAYLAVMNSFIGVCSTIEGDGGLTAMKEAFDCFELIPTIPVVGRKRSTAGRHSSFIGIQVDKKDHHTIGPLRPSAATFGMLLHTCNSALTKNSIERKRFIETIFRLCCDEGLVDQKVLTILQEITSDDQYSDLVVSKGIELDGIRVVPEKWTHQSLGLERVISADGRQSLPLSVDGKVTRTKSILEFRMRKIRDQRNQKVLRGGRSH